MRKEIIRGKDKEPYDNIYVVRYGMHLMIIM